ncbi:CHASE2 domain-containing protein [Trichothermofontia sp.]
MACQRVLLKLGKGTLATGLANIDAQLLGRDRCLLWQGTGSLPPSEELLALCQQWQKYYDSFCQYLSTRVLEIDPDVITNLSWTELETLSQTLSDRFQAWLGSESFTSICEIVLSFFSRDEETQVLITTDDQLIRLLPWHRWKLFTYFPHSDFAFSLPESQRIENQRKPDAVQILAILGVNEQIVRTENRQELNVEEDLRLLNILPKTKPIKKLFLPNRHEISNVLWEETIDILFFAGHSNSNENGEIGSFQINQHETVNIDQVKHGISQAVEHGLKLAIFNSCNGLGLAYQLSQLNVPYIIVMRQLVPDQVAIQFLEYFLKAFSGANGRKEKSLYLAMREARTRLEETWDDRFPCASWLPVLFQNPTVQSLTWKILQGYHSDQVAGASVVPICPEPEENTKKNLFDLNKFRQYFKKVSVISTITAIATIGLRLTTILEPIELHFYDQMMRQLPDRGPDPRLVIVEITEADIREFGQPMSDETLARLFKTLKAYQPMLIGFDIIRDRPEPPTPPELAELWQDPSIIPVCYTGDDEDAEKSSTGFPPGMPLEVARDRVGFNDLVMDEGGIIRRQLLSRTPRTQSLCAVETSFSYRLALEYFQRKNLPNTLLLKPLDFFAGGYQWLRNTHDSQILIRYRGRSNPANTTISMTELFKQMEAGQVENWEEKVILIGTTAPSAQDISPTPYGLSREGVVIHAHMLSQLISAVEDGEPLLTVWPFWQDWLWIWGWALLGGLLVLPLRHNLWILTSSSIIIIMFYGCCFVLFQRGLWVPFVPTAIALVLSSGLTVGSLREYDR